ncbi:receptor-type tyrosine-protein phosphatase V [Mus caroli]|uniref:Receptor-type tyrosine-protein phosphatase V n=1 Tax=Mus caroli TaxID=10089 RepID=A0A6P5PWM4_MUSCR|nr:receptor-type tyrosine-protein phosphatase V [Mus caroli]
MKMRPPILLATLLWLQDSLAQEDVCSSLDGSPDRHGGGPPLSVNVSSRGKSTSLFLSWVAAEPGGFDYALCLRGMNSSGFPEGQQLQAHTNESSFEFHGLVPGSRYQLELTVLRPCWQNVTITLTAQTAPTVVRGLQLHSTGSPASLEASWSDASGDQDSYQLLLYHPESQTLACNVSVSPDTLSYNFGDLLPGSQYVLEVITWAGSLHAKTSILQWTEPVPPDHLTLRALGTSSLQAFWNSSKGATWFHLILTDLLEGTNLTKVVRQGVSTHTFLRLSPGTPYQLKICAAAGPHQIWGPNATEWTYPSYPSDLVLTPLWNELWASWKAGQGARDGYVLKLSGPVESTTTLGPEECNTVFPGPLPPGHYTLGLRVLAGPYDAWVEGSIWLAESAVLPMEVPGARLWLEGLEATKQPGRRALLYSADASGLLGNISVSSGATHVTFCGLVPGARYRVDIASSMGDITQSLTGYTSPLPPQSLEIISRNSPSDLTIGWAPAPGQMEGYKVTWHQDGSQRSPGDLVDLGPDISSLTLKSLVPGSCYTVSAWAWSGNLSSDSQKIHSCTRPAPPTNLSLGFARQPAALRASWCHPLGGRDAFQLRLYRLRPLTLESEKILSQEAQNFSWAQLPAGYEFQVQLSTLWGSEESSSANTTGWTPPSAPTLVNVTSEAPTQLHVSWVHAAGDRSSYQVTLYQESVQTATSIVGPKADSTSFWGLTPGTKYKVEAISWAGPLYTAAANVSAWTYPLTPNELLASMQAGSAVVNLAWPSGPLGQGTCHAQLSDAGHLSWEQPLSLGQELLMLKNLTPGHTVSLSVKCWAGPLQASTHPVVLSVEPGPVEDVLCQPEATYLSLNWTMPAGDVAVCLVEVEQLVPGGSAHFVFQVNTSEDALLLPNLMPTTSYRLSLTVLGGNHQWSRAVTLVCTTSAEVWHPPELAEAPQVELGTGMGVTVTRGMFGKDDGQIQWYGIIATINMTLAQPSQEAINHTWYDHYYRGRDSYLALLFPNPFYPEPWAVPRSWTVPVGTEDCDNTQEICNGHLKPGFQYRFSIAAFSRLSSPETILAFSAFSEPQASISLVAMPLTVMMGTVVGCIVIVCAVLCLLCRLCLKGPRSEKNGFSQELMPYNLWRTHRPIPSHSFRQSYEAKSARAHQAFFQEFEELKEVGKDQPRLEAEHPANITKNRYPHVLPYDHSRVRLTQLSGEPHSDYINANFIPGYSHPQEIIATQGPLKKTLEDFWRLVWEQQVHVIIMLTVGMENGRVLCEHYWPVNSTPVTHGHITTHLLAEESEDEWTRREFQLQHGAEQKQRRVKQLQFTTWPDHSVPEAPSSLLAFVELVQEEVKATQGKGPILVHCSAGVGRTGTFVALLRLLRQLEEEQVVDVFNTVYILRLHRPLMIQTLSQYIFLHSCLLNKILEGPSDASDSGPIPVMNFAQACAKRAANANAGFLKEYRLLKQAIKDETGSLLPPPDYNQNSITSCHHSQEQLALVEESHVDNVLEASLFPGGPSGRDHVVLTGSAGPKELWEMVWEHGAYVLVSFGLPDTKEKPQDIWPMEMQPIVTDMVTVHRVAESNTAGWPSTLIRVIHGDSGMERQVQCLQFPHCKTGSELPANTLLTFLDAVGQCCSRGNSKKPGTLLSHSSKGTNQLGTFLAMEQLLQQAGTERTVDVFSVALKQSQACGLKTPTLEQYIYLYNCLNSALRNRLPRAGK